MKKKFHKIILLSGTFFLTSYGLASAKLFDIWVGTGTGNTTCNIAPAGCSFCDALKVAINIVNSATTAAIILTVGMMIYGAIRLMLAGGSEQMVKEAKGIFTSAVIGLIIVLCGWLIVNTFIHILSPSGVNFPWANVQC